jgi:hypothetical protein
MAASTGRKRTILALVLAGSLVGAAAALPALAAVTKKLYTPTISPMTSAPGATQPYTFTIRNAQSSNQSLGSANISVPSGFTVSTTSSLSVSTDPVGKAWTAALNGSTIQLRSGATSSNSLMAGQQVSVTFDAAAPCAAGNYVWLTQVKQSNDFLGNNNDFSLAPGAAYASVTVSSGACPGAPANIEFTVQPSDTLVDASITPAVEVTVTDAFNTPAPGTAVTMGLGTNPGGAGTLSGTLSQNTNSSGVATFANLAIDHSSSGYTLVATAGSLTATSDPFDITSDTANCAIDTCNVSATSDDGNSSVTVVSDGSGTLSVTFESVPLDCTSTGETFQVGVTFTIDPPSDATNVTATFDDIILPPFADHYPVCKTVEQDEVTTTHIVPFCSDNGDIPACVDSQEIQFHGSAPTTLHTVVRMTPTDPRTFH